MSPLPISPKTAQVSSLIQVNMNLPPPSQQQQQQQVTSPMIMPLINQSGVLIPNTRINTSMRGG
jgi:hypothetical protein